MRRKGQVLQRKAQKFWTKTWRETRWILIEREVDRCSVLKKEKWTRSTSSQRKKAYVWTIGDKGIGGPKDEKSNSTSQR
jgi:hypothetical protein